MRLIMKLGVNIDHVATLRQVRGTGYPDVVAAAKACLLAGAHGITVHLREDRRHIQDADVHALRAVPELPLNLEMANVPEMVGIACEVVPQEVCIVPEKREELTTEGGLDVAGAASSLAAAIGRLHAAGVAVSLFVEPDSRQIRAASDAGADMIELHTGHFCGLEGAAAEEELGRLIAAAEEGHALGLAVNAGHGINLDNIAQITRIPHLDTLNIGHSIVAQSVFTGLDKAVSDMLEAMGSGLPA